MRPTLILIGLLALAGCSDIYDPSRVNPALMYQGMQMMNGVGSYAIPQPTQSQTMVLPAGVGYIIF